MAQSQRDGRPGNTFVTVFTLLLVITLIVFAAAYVVDENFFVVDLSVFFDKRGAP